MTTLADELRELNRRAAPREPAYLKELYLTFPNDVAKVNGDDSWTLPMPARFVIDGGGTIRWASVDPDYSKRPEPAETVAALCALR
jgi:peroxiredoxin